MYFFCDKIENNLLHGTLNICTNRGDNKFDEIWDSVAAKGKLSNGKITLIY